MWKSSEKKGLQAGLKPRAAAFQSEAVRVSRKSPVRQKVAADGKISRGSVNRESEELRHFVR